MLFSEGLFTAGPVPSGVDWVMKPPNEIESASANWTSPKTTKLARKKTKRDTHLASDFIAYHPSCRNYTSELLLCAYFFASLLFVWILAVKERSGRFHELLPS